MRCTALLTLLLATNLTAQQNQPTPATPPYPPSVYRMNGVGKALDLTPDQFNRLDKMTTDSQARFAQEFQKLGTLPINERLQATRALQQRYQADWNKAARDVFNENQFNRYQQLRYQQGGFETLNDPEVQKRLNLSNQQMRDLIDATAWARMQQAELLRLNPTERDRVNRAYTDYQRELQTRFQRFLTPEQMRTWREMTGEPFQFQPNFR